MTNSLTATNHFPRLCVRHLFTTRMLAVVLVAATGFLAVLWAMPIAGAQEPEPATLTVRLDTPSFADDEQLIPRGLGFLLTETESYVDTSSPGNALFVDIEPSSFTRQWRLVGGAVCTGDDGALIVDGTRIRGTLPAGTSATCTFTENPLAARLTIVLGPEARFMEMSANFEESILLETEPISWGLNSGEYIEVAGPFNDGREFGTRGFTIECEDPNNAGATAQLDTFNSRISGELPAGADVTCHYVENDPDPTRPILFSARVTSEGSSEDVPGVNVQYFSSGNPVEQFTVALGETFSRDFDRGTESTAVVQAPEGWAVKLGECSVGRDSRQQTVGTTSAALRLTGSEHCSVTLKPADDADIVTPVVTCLAGNGRIDVNVVNRSDAAAEYTLILGALSSPRVRTVEPNDWWRSPITGRFDGPDTVQVSRNGEIILETGVAVECDESSGSSVTGAEVDVINVCRGGNGFVAWQFANPTAEAASYVIEFDGVANRSTTALAFGASVRGVSGRPDGTYAYTIRAGSRVIAQSTVTVACD